MMGQHEEDCQYSAYEVECQEVAYFGDRRKDQQWLSTNYDTWVVNPHYVGPDQPHPEEGDFS